MFQAEEIQWVETQEHMAQYVTLTTRSALTDYNADSNAYTRRGREQGVVLVGAHVNHISITKNNNKENFLLVTFATDVVLEGIGSTTARQTTTPTLTRSVSVGRQVFQEVCWSPWRSRQRAAGLWHKV
jgi:hypothetical protein